MKKCFSILLSLLSSVLLFLPQTALVSAQSAESLCVITKVGNPSVSPSLPPNCVNSGNSGNWRFPLESIDTVTGIATEMASYAGSFTYGGHVEHAGLDIGTPVGQQVPVYAINDGTVTEMRVLGPDPNQLCKTPDAGCNVIIKHDNDKFSSWYTHIDASVSVGQRVKKGDKIGVVHIWTVTNGNDHLHFELRLSENNININPRNYFPELGRFPASPAYVGGVRTFSATRGVYLLDDGKEWAETFRDHPPCLWNTTPGYCWAM